jgi:hypothetical protein
MNVSLGSRELYTIHPHLLQDGRGLGVDKGRKCYANDPLTAQAVLSVVLCSLLIQGPERMCPTEDWRAAVKMYETVELTGTPILKSL